MRQPNGVQYLSKSSLFSKRSLKGKSAHSIFIDYEEAHCEVCGDSGGPRSKQGVAANTGDCTSAGADQLDTLVTFTSTQNGIASPDAMRL